MIEPLVFLHITWKRFLAEKIETVLSRSIANTCPRDFYGIHILYHLRGDECNVMILLQALERTTNKRGSKKYWKIMMLLFLKSDSVNNLALFGKSIRKSLITRKIMRLIIFVIPFNVL